MGECPSHLHLARFKTGDLNPSEAEKVSRHLEACDKCRALSSSMDGNLEAFEKDAQSRHEDLMRALDREPVPLKANGPFAKKALTVGGLFAAAAAALFIMLFGMQKPDVAGNAEGLGFKGAFSVEVTANRDGRQFAVEDGTPLRQGDAVRFVVTADRPGYLTVFSKDQTGGLSPFYPDTRPSDDPKPLRVEAAGRLALPGSVILDDAAGKEEFVVIFSPDAFSRAEVHAKWDNGDMPSGGFLVQTLTVQKEPDREK